MREDLLSELDREYEQRRFANEQTEMDRRKTIQTRFPEIEQLVLQRENLIHGTIREMLAGNANGQDLPERMQEVNQKIREALCRAGLPEDYLSPVYTCPICRDTGYVGETVREPCSCLKEAYSRKLRESIGLTGDRKESFDHFDEQLIPDSVLPDIGITQRKLAIMARDACARWSEAWPDACYRDVLINGESGLGKTFLIRAMADRLISRGKQVLVISAYQFVQLARKSFFESDDSMDELMNVPVLMIDDLGSEPMMKSITVEQMFNLLNERQESGRSTVISTNLTLKELRERYTERIVSRLNNPHTCLMITLAGQDLRTIER